MTRIHQALSKQGEDVMKLSEKTFNKLIAAISTEFLEHGRDCGKHFISGEAAKL